MEEINKNKHYEEGYFKPEIVTKVKKILHRLQPQEGINLPDVIDWNNTIEYEDGSSFDPERRIRFNNHVFYFKDPSSKKRIFKIKVFKDDLTNPSRFERELAATLLLEKLPQFQKNEIDRLFVPKVVLADSNNHVIVYNHENNDVSLQDKIVNGDSVLIEEYMDILITYILEFSKIEPTPANLKINPYTTKDPSFTPYDLYLSSKKRLKVFNDFMSTSRAEKRHIHLLNYLDENGISSKIRELEEDILTGKDKDLLYKDTPSERRRLNHHDFAASNFLIQRDNAGKLRLCIVDLEYCGWDNPLNMIGHFIYHPQSDIFNEAHKQNFLKKIVHKLSLNKEEIRELNLRLKLIHLDWISVYLQNLAPEKWRGDFVGKRDIGEEMDSLFIDKFIKPVQRRISFGPDLYVAT